MLLDESSYQSLYREPRGPGDRGPGTAERLAESTGFATALGASAAAGAMRDAGVDPVAVTHLVTASCTCAEAPGFDLGLMDALGLSRDVRRTHIGFMGCHAAINALAVADGLATAHPGAVVLVCCVELCSLHLHYTDRADQLIANALFADGAAAAVVAARRHAASSPGPHTSAPVPLAHLAGFGSRVFVGEDGGNTRDAMSWRVGDHGFSMTLDRRVPDLLRRGVPGWIDDVLASLNLCRADVGGWAIHPGGPRIVQTIAECLVGEPSLRETAVDDSICVLHEHGNMSSATVLFILKRLIERRRARPWVAVAFGPGLAGEAVVLA